MLAGLAYGPVLGDTVAMQIPQELLDKAMEGGAAEQLAIGRLYAEGQIVPYDLDTAYLWFKRSAQSSLPEALLEVGLAKEYGLGTDRDYEAAFRIYMSVSRSYPGTLPFAIRGMVLTQNLCLDKHRGQLALAEAGFAHSQWAFVYGPERDHKWKEGKDAHKWIRKAAMLGYPPALSSMAWLIREGQGLPGEESLLLDWYLKAYVHDKLVAKSISMLYEPPSDGWLSKHIEPKVRGVEPDNVKSAEWDNKWEGHLRERRMLAVAAGSASDAKELGDLFFEGKQKAPQDYVEAMKWYLRAAELGSNWALGAVAKMYFNGLGVKRDFVKGLAFKDRQFSGTFCEGTKIVDQALVFHWAMHLVVEGYLDHLSEDQLFVWLQERTHAYEAYNTDAKVDGRITRLLARQKESMIARAEKGDAPSQFYYSQSFNRYKKRAGHGLKWLLKSAEQGFSPAQYSAAKAYIDGDGAPVSEPDARKWLLSAALQGHTRAQGDLIRVLAGRCVFGDREDGVERKPSAEDLFEGYAWSIACEWQLDESKEWAKYSQTKVLAAYRRADAIRALIL